MSEQKKPKTLGDLFAESDARALKRHAEYLHLFPPSHHKKKTTPKPDARKGGDSTAKP